MIGDCLYETLLWFQRLLIRLIVVYNGDQINITLNQA